jgi:hypothetical protein
MSKNIKLAVAVFAIVVSSPIAMASNIIRTNAPVLHTAPKETYNDIDPLVSEWVNSGIEYGCSQKAPLESDIYAGFTFTQTKLNCKQPQERTIQEREQSSLGEIRNKGDATVETRELEISGDVSAVGTGSNLCIFRNPVPSGYTTGSYVLVLLSNNRSYSYRVTDLGQNVSGGGTFPSTGARTLLLSGYTGTEGATIGNVQFNGNTYVMKAVCMTPK